jgi:hypothetical protein
MSNITAFNPRRTNQTVNLAVTASSASVATPLIIGVADINYRLVNSGPNMIFIEAVASSQAAATAALATSMPMLPNTSESFTFPPGAIVSAIASTTGNTLYITPGEGL